MQFHIEISGPRPLPQRFEEAAQAEIDKHLAAGVLVKWDELTDWCATVFFMFFSFWKAMGNE